MLELEVNAMLGLNAMREQGLRNLPKGDDYQGMNWFRR